MTRNLVRLYDYPASCNCYKVRLLLAQLGIPYERIPIDIFNGETLTDEYTRINPMRTTPVLETADGRHLPSNCQKGSSISAQ
ncbi:MAG: glutathione S-transferase N-terminal domain-containing protein [Solirubrobacteraceae bacterium]